MNVDYEKMILLFSQVIWPSFRIGALIFSLPFIASTGVPGRLRALFALSLALMCYSLVPEQLSFQYFAPGYIVIVVQELLLGMLMGFIFQLVFQIFIISGQIISMQMGLGFATMVDPASHSSVPFLSQFFLMLVTLIFLAMDGHLAVFRALFLSFKTLPIGTVSIDTSTLWRLMEFSAWMIKESLLVAIPAILALLAVNLTFAIITKVAPQMNIFSIGFPLTLLLGIIILKLCLPSLVDQISNSIETGMQVLTGMIS